MPEHVISARTNMQQSAHCNLTTFRAIHRKDSEILFKAAGGTFVYFDGWEKTKWIEDNLDYHNHACLTHNTDAG